MNEDLDETQLLRLRIEYLEHHLDALLFEAGKLVEFSSTPEILKAKVDGFSRLVNNTKRTLATYNPHRTDLPEHHH